MQTKSYDREDEKILLVLLPFWDPQIPPLGAACLKSYLRQHHYHNVKNIDANVEIEFREIFDEYYLLLKKIIPENMQGNIFNIGNQVMRNHFMAHLHFTDREEYIRLMKIVVEKTFFTKIDNHQLEELDEIAREFYIRLNRYVRNLLQKENPAVLGLTVYGDTFAASLAAFKIAKEWNPSLKTVMGGGIFADQLAPGSPALDYFVERAGADIDKIIIGEGEELFRKFLQGELQESQKVFDLSHHSAAILDINQVDIPDFSDFHLNYYPHLAHYGARSCPYQCKFCSETINWGKYRKKPVSQTVQEFMQLYQRHSSQLFLMTDSTLNPIITELSREFINSEVSIYWDGFLRADRHVCSTENTMLWRKGGFYRAKLGLESGSQRVLDLMDKRITLQQCKNALSALAYAGIKTTTFWLFGFPGETEADFKETLDFIEECKDNIYEADCNAFNYYLTGQVNSQEWSKNNKGTRLYPPWAKEMLITETWILDCEPSREIAYRRVNRFVRHCEKLGIPNPYSLSDVNKADERWKRLHKNAVPSVVALKNPDIYINENKYVKEFSFAGDTLQDDDEWF
ncbi:MAG: radical SAM protein [Candidatus Aminicenantes bacterium]